MYSFTVKYNANGSAGFTLLLNNVIVELFHINADHVMFRDNWSHERILSYLVSRHGDE